MAAYFRRASPTPRSNTRAAATPPISSVPAGSRGSSTKSGRFRRTTMRKTLQFILLALVLVGPSRVRADRLKELVTIEGVRSNALVGVGLVVGLAGTGDDASSIITKRPIAAMIKHLGLTVD